MNAPLQPDQPPGGDAMPGSRLGELLRLVRARDEGAARSLVELLYPLVAKVVQANLPRRDEPEDLIQEVFMKMFSRLEQYRGDAPFDHWVSRLAVTTCLDRLRRQRVRPELRWADLSEDEQRVLENAAPAAEATDADAGHAHVLMEKLLEAMPEADAWLIRQVEIEQKSLADVCGLAGWNAGAARVRLFRARRRLRDAFQELERTK